MKTGKSVNLRRQLRLVKSRSQPAAIGRDIQNNIGGHLRTVYRDSVNEPIPENIATLLRRMDVARKQ